MMKCKDCEFFHIRQEPLPHHMDTGLAECRKHNLVVDFYNHGKLNKLECVGEQEGRMMDKLKPCPFCGKEAIIEDCGEHRYFVRCTHCSIAQDKLFWQKCDAKRAWNTRKGEK